MGVQLHISVYLLFQIEHKYLYLKIELVSYFLSVFEIWIIKQKLLEIELNLFGQIINVQFRMAKHIQNFFKRLVKPSLSQSERIITHSEYIIVKETVVIQLNTVRQMFPKSPIK